LVAGSLLALVMLEGTSSALLLAHDVYTLVGQPNAERRHTQHDPELGWVNRPSVEVPDMYGPGLALRTNSLGFRGRELEPVLPENRARLVCSGDSYTLSYGVGDDQTWCELLGSLDDRLETVNMGQGGYGLDQAYLWYRRDGANLKPSLHLFAFTKLDFDRLATSHFSGIPKPVLAVRDGVLVAENTPVPQRSWSSSAYRALGILSDLRSFQLGTALLSRFRQSAPAGADQEQADTLALTSHVFESLRDINRAQDTSLVLVFLPMLGDYRGVEADALRRFVRNEADRLEIPYVDLVTGFKELAEQSVSPLFIGEKALDYAGAAGHYSLAGNQYVARRLRDELAALAAGSGARPAR
jgi:hypothetical protein